MMFVAILCMLLSSCATIDMLPFAITKSEASVIVPSDDVIPIEEEAEVVLLEEPIEDHDSSYFIEVARPLPAPIDFSAYVYGEDWSRPDAEENIQEEPEEEAQGFDPKTELFEKNNIVLVLILIHVMLIAIVFGAISAKRAWRYRRILSAQLSRKD